MATKLSLEEIVTIVKGVPEWKRDKREYDIAYTGVYTPNGSNKSILVSASMAVRTKINELLPNRTIHSYQASLKLGETKLTSLTPGQAKRVYETVKRAYLQKEEERADAERKKAVLEVKEALKGDSTIGARESRPFYRRFLG